jgi:hypothetical protein
MKNSKLISVFIIGSGSISIVSLTCICVKRDNK